MSQQTTTQNEEHADTPRACPLSIPAVSAEQLSDEEMQERYLEQQRRLACPGCGETPFLG